MTLAQPTGSFVEIGVLGPLVVVAGGRPTPISRGATSVLLELLALDPEPISSAAVAAAVESSTGRPCTRATIHTAIWRLRRALGSDEAIVSDDRGYRLDDRICTVDAARFERAVIEAQGSANRGDHAVAARGFGAAIALWRGALDTQSQVHPPVAARALRLDELRLVATEGWTNSMRAAGQPNDAARVLERLVVEHPLREHAWTVLLLSYLDAGRSDDARSAYDRARHHLAEHGLEPGAELHAALRRMDPVALADPTRPIEAHAPAALGLVQALDHVVVTVADAVASLTCVLEDLGDVGDAAGSVISDRVETVRRAVAAMDHAKESYLAASATSFPAESRL